MIKSMRALKVAEDIVPVGEFKCQAARWLRHAAESGQPVVITQNGKPAGVLVSPSEYDRLTERQRFLESVALGLADADAEAGRTMNTKELLRRLEERRLPGR
jgi:prevent-host-death family protein